MNIPYSNANKFSRSIAVHSHRNDSLEAQFGQIQEFVWWHLLERDEYWEGGHL